ncbi:MAG: GNAT family N-acetyltransferase, partial [Ruminococcaceae bacterium]|nr:GNAT family N-acetyltransferase [Oscillospiraceae bacterium]
VYEYSLPADVTVKRLLPENAADIVSVFSKVTEFAESQKGEEADRIEELAFGIEKNGDIGYGIFKDGEMISVAKTTAENDISAMVVGVATLEEYRKKGYASAMVARVCEESLKLGKKFICLFYDNPEAGKIYRKIGFKEIGKYAMLK